MKIGKNQNFKRIIILEKKNDNIGDIGGPFTNQLLHGDSLELLKDLPENSIDSIVTDPPY